MERFWKRWLSLLMVLALLAGFAMPSRAAAGGESLREAVEQTAAYLLGDGTAAQVGSIGGEWTVLALARSGYAVPQSYWEAYYAAAEAEVIACGGILHEKKYTEYARVALALTAIGADPTDIAGYDLLLPLGDFEKTIGQGVNGAAWALIALDSGNYDVPVNPDAAVQATRQRYVDELLSRQLPDGGWNLTDTGTADPDTTGMVLSALPNYQTQAKVKAAVDRALTCLSAQQDADGGFGSCESAAQVLTALSALGISPDDARFVKNGHTVSDALLSFRQSDGSFRHSADGSGNSRMATEQALYALVAAARAESGESGLFQMNDVTIRVTGGDGSTVGLPGKNAAVTRVPISAPDACFADAVGHENQTAIEALAARAILNGKGSGQFDPDATMTRAEFAAAIVRALGLTPERSGAFTDVADTAWYAPYVGTASAYGIVNGVGSGKFDPNGTITRQQAAAMVARAAALCGLDTAMDDTAVRDMLAQFGDYVTISRWAAASMAFCYREEILDRSDLNTEPSRAILRGEVAQMVYRLLDCAKLL
jgi:hypothetical protein